ncbi:response regulator transcription factor [Bacillus spongiae]|uniref:Response regulator transcription factor n=1 Tax=Bacillus spongiae TaxID=2683610 RepID=A0ABU8HHL2_9BACI
MERTVLIVDDDQDIVMLISESLKFENYKTTYAHNGKEALEILQNKKIDIVILDIMMPHMDGIEVCKKIREVSNIPILLLSAKDRDIDKIIGLEIGADDYITKPFNVNELVARVRAHFRKMDRILDELTQEQESMTNFSSLSLNKNTYEVYLQGEKLNFSTKEFQLLDFLATHPNQVFSREQIYQNVWEADYGDLNNVTVHIKNIRRKLGKDHDYIKTIWGVGYKFSLEGKAQ